MTPLGVALATGLCAFAAWRLRGLLSLRRAPRPIAMGPPPSAVTVVVAARDEAGTLEDCLQSLGAQDGYADARWILVDDASSDGTLAIMRAWEARRAGTTVLTSPGAIGKAGALNRAIAADETGDVLVVVDADVVPASGTLRRLVAALGDPEVGAASGIRLPFVVRPTPVALYAALEALVHQRVTLTGQDRGGMNPPLMGSLCAYRRVALSRVGGFRPGAFSEDVETALSLSALGWRTRVLDDATGLSPVPATLRGFVRQRLRWTSGLYSSAARARTVGGAFAALGYSDRLVCAAALVASAFGHLSPAWLAVYATPPAAAVMVALARSPEFSWRWRAALSVPVVFPLDVAVSIAGSARHALTAPGGSWRRAP